MVSQSERLLFVEGGGDHHPVLASECRRAFSKLLERAGVRARPRVVVCGGRRAAYDQFMQATARSGIQAWLLVDAEEPVSMGARTGDSVSPRDHLRLRVEDGWAWQEGAVDDQIHLMTVCMETWLLADHDALGQVFGPKLAAAALPPEGGSLESLTKAAVFGALEKATKGTKAGPYGKRAHSFRVLAHVSPTKLGALLWARRLLVALGAERV